MSFLLPALLALPCPEDDAEHNLDLSDFGLEFGDSLQSGLDALVDPSVLRPSQQNELCAKGVYVGSLRYSKAHGTFLKQCRAIHRRNREKTDIRSSNANLGSAWNAQRMREGDCVNVTDAGDGDDGHDDGPTSSHANKFTSPGIMRTAWCQLGKNRTLRVGVDGCSRELSILSSVASVARMEQQQFDRRITKVWRDTLASPTICRAYDATPKHAWFGRLQEEIQPHARYPWYGKGEDKWKSLKFSDFMQKCSGKQRHLTHGTVELLATGTETCWIDKAGLVNNSQTFHSPVILQNSQASCIYSATESADCEYSYENIVELAGALPFLCLAEAPDACVTNKRKIAKGATVLNGARNVFHHQGKCGSHQCHRMIEIFEQRTCGDVHACACALGDPSHAHMMQVSWFCSLHA